jgi:hypothetical protein
VKHEPLSLQPHTVSPRKDRMNTSSPYQPLTGKIVPPNPSDIRRLRKRYVS